MAVKAKCIVTNSEEGRGAYAIRVDNDESLYIPQRIAEALEIEEFDELEAILVRNDRDEPPWRAIRVRHAAEADRPAPEAGPPEA